MYFSLEWVQELWKCFISTRVVFRVFFYMRVNTYKKKVGVKIKDGVEMYIITMSAQSHMLLGSVMKTSQREREERE